MLLSTPHATEHLKTVWQEYKKTHKKSQLLKCVKMKGKHLHGVYSGCGYGRGALGSVMMRGASNEKHQAPSNLLA